MAKSVRNNVTGAKLQFFGLHPRRALVLLISIIDSLCLAMENDNHVNATNKEVFLLCSQFQIF
jgi:hypothetical protein